MLKKTAFLLSHHSIDIQQHAHIQLWVHDGDAPSLLHISQQPPLFFVETHKNSLIKQLLLRLPHPYDVKELEHKNFDQELMSAYYFSSLKAFHKAKKLLQQQKISVYEGDIHLSQRFLMERYVKGGLSFDAELISSNKDFNEYDVSKIITNDFSLQAQQLSTASIDIECSGQGQLFSIAIDFQRIGGTTSIVLMLGDKPSSFPNYIRWMSNEKALLEAFIEVINDCNPDIIVGWNVINFDFKLLLKRAEFHAITLNIGRDRSPVTWRQHQRDKSKGFVSVFGRIVIDGIDALKQASYQFSSFSLDNVANALLNKGKKAKNVDNRLEEIEYNFKHNKIELAAYNLQDCQLVSEIFAHTGIIGFLLYRQQLTGLTIDKIGGSVMAFDYLYLPQLHRANYIAPNLQNLGGLTSPGGYVMNSEPGLYKNVLVLDFKSLYPSIIRTFKIDPMGLIEGLKTPENSVDGFKGACFSREKHFLPAMIEQLWQEREHAKSKDDEMRSQAIKIMMNSFYGVLGSSGCRFYDTRLASSITLRGHQIMQQTQQWIEEQGYRVIYGDTDSIFVLLDEHLMIDEAQEIGLTLRADINQLWKKSIQQKWQLPSYLEIEFETLYRRFFMPTIRGQEIGSKKRYAGLSINNDGNRIIFKGLEAVRSDWTVLAQEFQRKIFNYVFTDKDPSAYIQQYVHDLLAGSKDNQLVFRKQLRRPLLDYQKNIPPHVQAAIKADSKNLQEGSALRYQHKGWIRYVITIAGPEALEKQEHRLDYAAYVDRQLKPIADAILPYINLSFAQIMSPQIGLI